MCGIVGYIGDKNAQTQIINGLTKLEYRGYDSAGVATVINSKLQISKSKGRIEELNKVLDKNESTIGIGHTRWATHGAAEQRNAHPHLSPSGRIAIVHNGIIENYRELKEKYLNSNDFKSDTDTEVVAHLIEKFEEKNNDLLLSFMQVLNEIEGSYALGMLDLDNPGTLYSAKNKSPLLVGVGVGENMIASDASAVINLTDKFIELEDGEIVVLTKDSVKHFDLQGQDIERAPFVAEIDPNDLEKGTYPHYMLKEIDEQPAVIRHIIEKYLTKDGESFDIPKEVLDDLMVANRLYIVACGTSYNAGLVGAKMFEQMAGKPTEVHIASEFTVDPPLMDNKSFVIFISQSGETADSREALQMVRRKGYKTLTITNVKGSTLSREADHTLLLYAGPEIAVASTKAYTAQIAVMAIVADRISSELGNAKSFDLRSELSKVAQVMESIISDKHVFESLSQEFLIDTEKAFFLGRTMDYLVCVEGALKLKEISYIQAEGFAGGELKHGTIALIEKGVPVIAPITNKKVNLMTRSNLQEVEARGANTCIISMEELSMQGDSYVIPKVSEILSPLVSVLPMQLISYYAALQRGCDIDKPRNLAKSVTVM